MGFGAASSLTRAVPVAVRAFASAAPAGVILELLEMAPNGRSSSSWPATWASATGSRSPGAVPQDEALRRIRDYDVVLVPSLTTRTWKEQFGRVAAQALAAGTPVVASDSGSLSEVVGDAGELAREGDVDDFAQRLGRLLRDNEQRSALSERGRARARERFTWERVVDGCDRMYREVLEGRGHPDSSDSGSGRQVASRSTT